MVHLRWQCDNNLVDLHSAYHRSEIVEGTEHFEAPKVAGSLVQVVQETNQGITQVGGRCDVLHNGLTQPPRAYDQQTRVSQSQAIEYSHNPRNYQPTQAEY